MNIVDKRSSRYKDFKYWVNAQGTVDYEYWANARGTVDYVGCMPEVRWTMLVAYTRGTVDYVGCMPEVQ